MPWSLMCAKTVLTAFWLMISTHGYQAKQNERNKYWEKTLTGTSDFT